MDEPQQPSPPAILLDVCFDLAFNFIACIAFGGAHSIKPLQDSSIYGTIFISILQPV